MRLKIAIFVINIITLLLLAATVASGQTSEYVSKYDQISKCIASCGDTNLLAFWNRPVDYKPPPKPTLQDVLGTNADMLVPMLTNVVQQVNALEVKVRQLNAPIEKQIDYMLRWAIDEAVDEMLAWMKTTNATAYLSDTNEYGQWARSIGISRDVRDKIAADRRGMVTSINWPVVTQSCQRTHCDTPWPYVIVTNSGPYIVPNESLTSHWYNTPNTWPGTYSTNYVTNINANVEKEN